MRYNIIFSALALAATTVLAEIPPAVPGMVLTFSDDFAGPAGGEIDLGKWQYYKGAVHNNEEQDYPENSDNCKLSGAGSFVIKPVRNEAGKWQSCRLESKQAWAPPAGGKVMFSSRFRVGSPDAPANMQGVWPAFWALGQSMREGTNWPACGEIDTFENVSGDALGHGTVHCGEKCNSPTGNGATMPFNRAEYVTWSHVVSPDSIEWFRDGQSYHIVKKADLSDSDWDAVGQKAFFITFNVAMGGGWPGATVADTASGAAAQMELQYVAVYTSGEAAPAPAARKRMAVPAQA